MSLYSSAQSPLRDPQILRKHHPGIARGWFKHMLQGYAVLSTPNHRTQCHLCYKLPINQAQGDSISQASCYHSGCHKFRCTFPCSISLASMPVHKLAAHPKHLTAAAMIQGTIPCCILHSRWGRRSPSLPDLQLQLASETSTCPCPLRARRNRAWRVQSEPPSL